MRNPRQLLRYYRRMSSFYGPKQRQFQDAFDSRRLADRFAETIVRTSLSEKDRLFIGSCDMFFLSTIDHNGWPTVSYKGGAPGFVRIVDDRSLAFPCYNGNGMFLSMGNIEQNRKIGLLFIDFEHPRRLRVHGLASVSSEDPLMADYKEATLIVRVAIENIFTNCARYIHRYQKIEQSAFVPAEDRATPRAPWKQLEHLQDVLPASDVSESDDELISEADYRSDFWRGLKNR